MSKVVRIIQSLPEEKHRIGLVAPHYGRVMEEEYPLVAPQVTWLISSLRVGEARPERLEQVLPNIERSALALESCGAEVIIQCGTPVVFFKGYGFDDVIIERIQKATFRPASTMATSVVKALKELRMQKLVVVTPYMEELNVRLKKFLEDHGLEVLVIKRLPVLTSMRVDEINIQPPERSYEFALETYSSYKKEADGIFISCGGFRTLEMMAQLEREIGKPCTSSNQATIWNSLRMCGLNDPITGFGSLLLQHL